MIVSYSAIGGFRGSVYTDTLQAVIRILGTLIALAGVMWMATRQPDIFFLNLAQAGEDFLVPFAHQGIGAALGFVGGFAAASIGFGLGQPQIVSRYLAGRSPQETRAAMWIYIGFVQFTWIAMTLFGILLRGVMPDLADPETGLSTFFQNAINPVATGIIVADVFATIASTSNGLLVAMSQAVVHDLLPSRWQHDQHGWKRHLMPLSTIGLGMMTLLLSFNLHGTVVNQALFSVSLMGAGLAPAVIIKLMGWQHQAASLLLTVFGGLVGALLWVAMGYHTVLNEAAIGIASGLLVHLLCRIFLTPASPQTLNQQTEQHHGA